MWKQVSKINFYNYFNYFIDNFSFRSKVVFDSDWKVIHEYYSSFEILSNKEFIELSIFRRVSYSNCRVTYFVSKPFINWFKNILEVKNEK